MARSGRQLAIPHRPQLAAQRLHRDRDVKRLPNPLRQIDEAPAHHAVDGRIGAGLHALCQCAPLRIGQPWVRSGSLAIDQPVRPLLVETHHPVAHDLWRHTGDLGRSPARHALMDRSQSDKPARLARVARSPRKLPQCRRIEVAAQRNGSSHGNGKHLTVCHLESYQPLTMSHPL